MPMNPHTPPPPSAKAARSKQIRKPKIKRVIAPPRADSENDADNEEEKKEEEADPPRRGVQDAATIIPLQPDPSQVIIPGHVFFRSEWGAEAQIQFVDETDLFKQFVAVTDDIDHDQPMEAGAPLSYADINVDADVQFLTEELKLAIREYSLEKVYGEYDVRDIIALLVAAERRVRKLELEVDATNRENAEWRKDNAALTIQVQNMQARVSGISSLLEDNSASQEAMLSCFEVVQNGISDENIPPELLCFARQVNSNSHSQQ